MLYYYFFIHNLVKIEPLCPLLFSYHVSASFLQGLVASAHRSRDDVLIFFHVNCRLLLGTVGLSVTFVIEYFESSLKYIRSRILFYFVSKVQK